MTEMLEDAAEPASRGSDISSVDRYSVYKNTQENAAHVGWDRLPEYCVGDPTDEFVIHDHRSGIFIYIALTR